MGLISLLIALAAEKTLSAKVWQFNFYFSKYLELVAKLGRVDKIFQTPLWFAGVVLAPTAIIFLIEYIIDEALVSFVISTLVLIVCFGCTDARQNFKRYLLAAFRGDMVSSDLTEHEMRKGRLPALDDSDIKPEQSFGQLLIWINYRYYFAVMLFFILFGAAGAVFYRLLVTFAEQRVKVTIDLPEKTAEISNQWLAIIDLIPVRIASFGYMFVGHFSNAIAIWLDNLFRFEQTAQKTLAVVAKASEDFMIKSGDCTSEPCVLVRLAKRNNLLFLAMIAVMTLAGVVS